MLLASTILRATFDPSLAWWSSLPASQASTCVSCGGCGVARWDWFFFILFPQDESHSICAVEFVVIHLPSYPPFPNWICVSCEERERERERETGEEEEKGEKRAEKKNRRRKEKKMMMKMKRKRKKEKEKLFFPWKNKKSIECGERVKRESTNGYVGIIMSMKNLW